MKRPAVIAHRGASGYVIENSMKSFKTAWKMNAEMVELDVQETNDGHIVVFHDYDLTRISGNDGYISEMTLKEIQEIDIGDGHTIPLLGDVLDFARGKIGVDIEIKVPDIEERILSMVIERDMLSDLMFSSYLHATLLEIKGLNSDPLTGILYTLMERDPVEYVQELGLDAINPPFKALNLDIVERAHEQGLQVFPYTVNDSDMMLEMVQMGVDGIITDLPDKCIEIINEVYSK